MEAYPSVWIITKPAALFTATLNLFNTAAGTLIPTNAILTSDSLDTLVSLMPRNRRRMPRFSGQAATVLENWV